MVNDHIYMFFTGKNPLSNFYRAEIKLKSAVFVKMDKSKKRYKFKKIFPEYVDSKGRITFHTTEQYFMFCKALLFKDLHRAEKILNTDTPYGCKKHGKQVVNFEEDLWSKNKKRIMFKACLRKFKTHPELKEFLLDTSPLILAEASPWDSTWGIGLSAENPNAQDVEKWKGQNLLGVILMKVRDKLQKEDS